MRKGKERHPGIVLDHKTIPYIQGLDLKNRINKNKKKLADKNKVCCVYIVLINTESNLKI